MSGTPFIATPISRLARLQQALALGAIAVAAGWATWRWEASPVQALGGAWLLLFGYALVLAVEFGVMAWVNRSDPVPAPGLGELLRAWWQEVRVAPLVFSWRQPFRWRTWSDDVQPVPGRTAVVFVHGFVCNRGFWLPWMRRLRAQGRPYASVNLEPVFGAIDRYVALVEAAVQAAERLGGRPPVLVCHSMGGLAARAWMAATPGADRRVARVVTIGTPHHGTWLGHFSHLPNGRQMRPDNAWLGALAVRERALRPEAPYGRFVCWYSHTDNIVFPTSTACLPGADNRFVPGRAHVAMAFDPVVMDQTLALLDAADRVAGAEPVPATAPPLSP